MKNFNQLTALNRRLQEDRCAVAQQRWQAVQRIELRQCRAEERALRAGKALDWALCIAMVAAIIVLAAVGV